MNRYKAFPGTRFNDKDANVIGNFLDEFFPDKFYDKELIVEFARDPKCPIHKYFDWDDTSAAHKYRLQQARKMINCVLYIKDDGMKYDTPKAISVKIKGDTGVYMDTQEISRNPDIHDMVMEKALKDLKGWQIRFARLREIPEMVPIFNLIEKTLEDHPSI